MLETLRLAISECMMPDQVSLRKRLLKIQKQPSSHPNWKRRVRRLTDDIRRSQQRCRRRRDRIPELKFPEELPIASQRSEIAETIDKNQVVVVCGETGSGKTTQIPKICLSLGRGVSGLIGHTQPRRIAARSVAARIAKELGTELGATVGYKVRFTGRVSPDSYIKLMTDGILLAETQGDRYLRTYDTLIIDEAHERSLNIDFLFGYLKQLLPHRPDLKLIITSATIDPESFSKHFHDAPIVEIPGRSYPVEVRYRPSPEVHRTLDTQTAILEAIEEAIQTGRGDILVFLTGEREIRETAAALRRRRFVDTEVLPLYARLGTREQDKAFEPHNNRRILLATNVAETSLTVPNVHFVIDPGYARISRYSFRSRVQRLPIEKVSRASADQRKGRCGRVGPGVCTRLYSEEDYERRSIFTEPAIRRTNLAAVILQMETLELGHIEAFPFIDPPDRRYIADGYRLLRELHAIDAEDKLTPLGRKMARLPLDPRIGRMVIAASENGCLREMLVIASALSLQDPRERPSEKRELASEAHKRFQDEHSDFLSFLKLWDFYHDKGHGLSTHRLRRLCQGYYLSFPRMREWQDVHQQLTELTRELGLRQSAAPSSYAQIHRAVLTGLLTHVGTRTEGGAYLGVRESAFHISPMSGLFKCRPKWIVAAELIETQRRTAYGVARIRPEWIERVGAHLLGRSCFEPHWDERTGRVMAFERLTLYGLTVNPRRRVHYAPIEPEESRQIFMQSALVEERYERRAPFLVHNRKLMSEVQALEDRTRRPDLLASEQDLFRFYDERIPEGINSRVSFETWRRQAEKDNPETLFFDRARVISASSSPPSEDQFPGTLSVNGCELRLEYRFEPSSENDGITVIVPSSVLGQLTPKPFEWLVPGMRRDKVIALMRSLPKHLRRHLVPLPEIADACLGRLEPEGGGLQEGLTKELYRMTGVEIPNDAWREEKMPRHLFMSFRIVDAGGRALGSGRDLLELQQEFAGHAEAAFRDTVSSTLEREGITKWDFGNLPRTVEFSHKGANLTGYPALVDEKDAASLRILPSEDEADTQTRHGLMRLFMLQLPRDMRYLRRNLSNLQKMCLIYTLTPASPYSRESTMPDTESLTGPCEELRRDLVTAIVAQSFLGPNWRISTAEEFESRRTEGARVLMSVANEFCSLVEEILDEYRTVMMLREAASSHALAESFADMDQQLHYLLHRGFLRRFPVESVQELPRYLRAVSHRIKKLEKDPGRDIRKLKEIRPLWRRYVEHSGPHAAGKAAQAELERFRWMLEEMRVSLFAQELGTAQPISFKRLEKQWVRCHAMME